MDARTTMIIAKGKFVTTDVTDCIYHKENHKWEIVFKSGRSFFYNQQNVLCLKNPRNLDPQKYQVCRKGKILDNIETILSFSAENEEYWHLVFSTGYEHDYSCRELQVERSIFENSRAKKVFDYLKEAADVISVRAEDQTAILTKQYEKIDFLSRESAAAVYLDPSEYEEGTNLRSEAPIFPFGCNESQFMAVTNALSNRISVIEGPPGTGKTQTILNIIANLVLQGKTVQVVSNNNSAIENVQEKLSSTKYQMDFFVALLGKDQRKEEFLQKQTGRYPELEKWKDPDYETPEFFENVRNMSLKLQGIFRDKNRLAELYQERSEVQLEAEHYDVLRPDCPSGWAKSSKKLTSIQVLRFLQEYMNLQEHGNRVGLLRWLKCRVLYGVNVLDLLREKPADVLDKLHELYYRDRTQELDREIQALEEKLEGVDAEFLMNEFTEMSLCCFRAHLAERYGKQSQRPVFSKEALWKTPGNVLEEYPVVLSTTYTARSSLGKYARFDYVVMDEASQVDVATGCLALSCARNAVIVGDTKQLPNVIASSQKKHLEELFEKYNIEDAYDFSQYSFLESLFALMKNRVPRVILREHYRCHPLIIGFCNQKFYNNELIVMTPDHGENALKLVLTVPGQHERDRMNQRQIDVIKKDVLPGVVAADTEIGVIAPYRNQVYKLKEELNRPEIDISTVHKFQGREKDVIVLSTVDDIVTSFSDDPNLLNVAVSRAKKELVVVASEMEQPAGSNMGELIDYIRYHNCDVQYSAVSSVFDYLYKQYRDVRLDYLQKRGRISEFDSENLVYHLIRDELYQRKEQALDVVFHQPLYLLIRDLSKLDNREKAFVNSGVSHLDFLIYNRVSKRPILAIEVDGYRYHKEGTKQAERDKIKDDILAQYGVPLVRFATNGSDEARILSGTLDKIMGTDVKKDSSETRKKQSLHFVHSSVGKSAFSFRGFMV